MLLPTNNREADILPEAAMLRAASVNSGLLGLVADHDLSQAAIERANNVLSTLVSGLTDELGTGTPLAGELTTLLPDTASGDIDELHVNVVVLHGWLSGTFAGRALPQPSIAVRQVLALDSSSAYI